MQSTKRRLKLFGYFDNVLIIINYNIKINIYGTHLYVYLIYTTHTDTLIYFRLNTTEINSSVTLRFSQFFGRKKNCYAIIKRKLNRFSRKEKNKRFAK